MQAGRVDVWWVSLTDDPGGAAAVLSEQERRRCARLRSSAHRRRYRIAHVRVREILGTYLNQDPARIALRADRLGKPHVRGPNGIRFSLSHSGEMAVVAVTTGRRVGVDVERVRELPDLDRLARMTMTDGERRALEAVARSLRGADFCQRWTCKEAVAKALGAGLRLPLQRIAVEVGADGDPRLVELGVPGERAGAWALRRLSPPPHHRAAVAVEIDHAPSASNANCQSRLRRDSRSGV